MNEVSKEYATALFSLAEESGQIESVAAAMKEVSEVFAAHPDYLEMLASPAISSEEKNDSLDKVFTAFPEHVVSFLKLLASRGRISGFSDVYVAFEGMVQFSRHMASAAITTAVELSESEKQALVAKLEKKTGKKILPNYRVDPSLIGGVTVEIDGMVYDGSLRSRLNEVKGVMGQ